MMKWLSHTARTVAGPSNVINWIGTIGKATTVRGEVRAEVVGALVSVMSNPNVAADQCKCNASLSPSLKCYPALFGGSSCACATRS